MTETYTLWLTLAVVVGALALVVQAACLYAVFKAFQSLQARMLQFMPKAEATLAKAEVTLARAEQAMAESRADLQEIATKAHTIMDLTHGQLTRVDEFVTETTGRARVQVDRVEALLDESLERARHTVGLVTDTVTRPVREVNAISAGLRAAFGSFFSKRRNPDPRPDYNGDFGQDANLQAENSHQTMSEVD